MFTPFSPPLALWREVYVCVEQLLEWIHRGTIGLQKFAVIKVTHCVKYRLKLWRVGMEGMERMGGVAGEGSGVVDSDRGKVIKWR